MMKRFFAALLTLTLSMAALTSCTSEAPASESAVSAETMSFSDYLDLGNKCLSEGNYEEAIIAFTAAIEIDPNIADAYLGRAEAYVFSGETAENLSSALADYENVLAMDETNAAVYLGIADVYIRQSEFDKALEILQTGLDKTGGNAEIAGKIEEIESGNITDSQNRLRGKFAYGENGELIWYHTFTYDEQGRRASATSFDSTGNQTSHVDIAYTEFGEPTAQYHYGMDTGVILPTFIEYDANGQETKRTDCEADGTVRSMYTYQYDSNGNVIRSDSYSEGGNTLQSYQTFEYDENGNQIKSSSFMGDGTPNRYKTSEYDAEGRLVKQSDYFADGELLSTQTWEYDTQGRQTKNSSFDSNGLREYTVTEYNAADMISGTYTYAGDGTLRSYTENVFDENGNSMGINYYDGEGNLEYSTQYE